MAKPLVEVDTIYDAALRILDKGGVEALNARNLAAQLKCSTRTLYNQVGKRDELVDQLMNYYFGGLEFEFKDSDCWQESTRSWANNLREALLSHPNLTRLMTLEHRAPFADCATALLKVLLRAGFSQQLALRSCRALTHFVMNLTLEEIIAPRSESESKRRARKEIQFEDLVIANSHRGRTSPLKTPEVFDNTLDWLLIGI
ncbi:MAG: TetR/AcrR family transcriptional regulator C-terminal domain-containing protein, partial [Halioglobus sp.]